MLQPSRVERDARGTINVQNQIDCMLPLHVTMIATVPLSAQVGEIDGKGWRDYPENSNFHDELDPLARKFFL